MHDIWQTVPDSKTITIEQNVGFQRGIYPEKCQLDKIQNDRLVAIFTLLFVMSGKPYQIARPLLASGKDVL